MNQQNEFRHCLNRVLHQGASHRASPNIEIPNLLTEQITAGLDEAGRGPLAGPVTGACVVLPVGYEHKYLADSKKLTHVQRECAFIDIVNSAHAFSVVSVGARRIDAINIREASRLAMKLAAFRVSKQIFGKDTFERDAIPANFSLLIDGNMKLGTIFKETAIIKGDQKIKEISAASILAKVTRDWLMGVLERKYPGYDFCKHKGYPTKDHLARISTIGASRVHRQTFRGVKQQ